MLWGQICSWSTIVTDLELLKTLKISNQYYHNLVYK